MSKSNHRHIRLVAEGLRAFAAVRRNRLDCERAASLLDEGTREREDMDQSVRVWERNERASASRFAEELLTHREHHNLEEPAHTYLQRFGDTLADPSDRAALAMLLASACLRTMGRRMGL